jgi:hypothetical protein
MHRCEMEINGRLELPCGDRASIRIEKHWYCPAHADALAQAEERWSGIHLFPLTYGGIKEPSDERHDYSSLFDDDEEE